MEIEKPDAILHFTDPRFWIWFYNMESEIRRNIPIFYYNIWDDLPDPQYNTNYYRSCDLLMGISKQTYGINKRLLKPYGYEDWQITYVPHGISPRRFYKIEDDDAKLLDFEEKHRLLDKKFKILYSNRNIRRKQPGDVLMAYKYFMDELTPGQREECVLVWHCAPIDDNGTDLPRQCRHLIPDYDICFTYEKHNRPFNDDEMKDIEYLWKINVMGPWILTKQAWKYLSLSNSARIIVLVSMSGKRSKGNLASYSMSKFALMSLCQTMRNEGWEKGIRVTAICPGWVNTDMAKEINHFPKADMTQANDIASICSNLLDLPNSSVPFEIALNCQLEQ